jgi:transcriptional regulator GlxA family with amidase domain
MSRSAFAERFKTTIGMGPMEYVTRWRVHAAARLLRKTDRSVGSLALNFGFGSASSVIRVFTRVTRQSPTRYRLGEAERTSVTFPDAAA